MSAIGDAIESEGRSGYRQGVQHERERCLAIIEEYRFRLCKYHNSETVDSALAECITRIRDVQS